jgi:hypothetical protein
MSEALPEGVVLADPVITVSMLEARLAQFVRDVRTPCPLPHYRPEVETVVGIHHYELLKRKADLWDKHVAERGGSDAG